MKAMVISNTSFSDAIIDNPEFIRYLRTQRAPNEVKNRQELVSSLERKKHPKKSIG
jgi:hypothetical protein